MLLVGGKTTFLDRLRKGKPVIVHGDGNSFWTSCHSDDIASAFVGALQNRKAFGKGYHATPDEWLTWNRYHQLVAEAMGAPEPELIHIPTDVLGCIAPTRSTIVLENFHFNNIFDNSAARTDLGFQARVPFREGMRRTIEWVESTGGVEDSATEPWYDRIIAAWQKSITQLERELEDIDEKSRT
jgi:nucleoside-diphosphate-sugar epimerase